MKTYKIGADEMENRKIDFDFRHVSTIDHGNGMVTEITACYLPSGTLFRFCDCLRGDGKDVHIISVNYQLDPAIVAGQVTTDPEARVQPISNITTPYLEHEYENGKIDFGEESSPMDSSEFYHETDSEDEDDIAPVTIEAESEETNTDEDESVEEENSVNINQNIKDKIKALMEAGLEDDDDSEEEDEDSDDENDIMFLDEETHENSQDISNESKEEVNEELDKHVQSAEKPRKHYMNNPTPSNNNRNKKFNNYKKENKFNNNNKKPQYEKVNKFEENSNMNNALLNAISKGWD